MLNNDQDIKEEGQSKKRKFKIDKPTRPGRLSLNLHTMPHSSDHHLKKWILWGLLILLVLVIIAYFIFN